MLAIRVSNLVDHKLVWVGFELLEWNLMCIVGITGIIKTLFRSTTTIELCVTNHFGIKLVRFCYVIH
jgi:hypothetical protein